MVIFAQRLHNNLISTQILQVRKSHVYNCFDFDKSSWVNGLHCISFSTIDEIAASLVAMESCDSTNKITQVHLSYRILGMGIRKH